MTITRPDKRKRRVGHGLASHGLPNNPERDKEFPHREVNFSPRQTYENRLALYGDCHVSSSLDVVRNVHADRSIETNNVIAGSFTRDTDS